MTTARQAAALLLLSTALSFPTMAFAQDVSADAAPSAEPAEEEAPEISIPGGGNTIIVTGRINRDPTRNSAQVISVLSSEQIARTGEGDIAGALGRVTGLSVQGQGFVYVRGLGDRYSLALLNGLPLPSPQPLSRVVPLDIFPTNIVASSLVQKTYSANFPGEFGGGVINLTTRAIPEESFLRIGVGGSIDVETNFQNGLAYYGSDFDWFGFDDGTRDAPAALQSFYDSGRLMSDLSLDEQGAIGQQLGNPNLILLQKIGDIPANWSASLTGGMATDIGDDVRLGVIATASINSKSRTRDVINQEGQPDLSLLSDFRDLVTDNRVLVNGLLGFGLEFGEHQIRWTNLFIRDTQKVASLSQGNVVQDNDDHLTQSTAFYERQLMDSQIVAEFEFDDLSLDLRGGFARTEREAPYEYEFDYVCENVDDSIGCGGNNGLGNQFINVMDGQTGNVLVAFSDLTEDLWFGGIDLSYPLTDWLTATVGYAYTDTSRYSERREFRFNASADFDDAVGLLRPDLLLGDAIIDYYNIGLIETTQSDPAFQADLTIHGGYGQVQLQPADVLSLNLGVRYEEAEQSVVPVNVFSVPTSSGRSTLLNNDYFLPAATVTWEATDDLQIRANASRTIARPQFRELIFQTYYDPETNRQFNGNPSLIDSELTNYEVRGEYYLGRRGRSVSLAGFYKDIARPIEAYLRFEQNSQITSFANAPQATLYGAEFDFQYAFDLAGMGGFFETKELVVLANYTWTQSDVSVAADDTTVVDGTTTAATNVFRDGGRLTGQSDHLVNFQIGVEDLDRLQQFTVLMNYSSDRVTSRGVFNQPDVIENPGLTVDFVMRQGLALFGSEAELKLEARNIFGRDNLEYQQNETTRIDINTYDVGQSFAASLSFEF